MSTMTAVRPAAPTTTNRLDQITRILGWVLIPAVLFALYMALVFAPAEATMGEVYRIFFFHLPANIGSFFFFFIAFAVGIAYLRTRNQTWDLWGAAAVEIGILASFIGTATGSIWARPIWNTWWTWDPRLVTITILLLTYIGYFMLRGALDDPERRARYSAVFAILAFANIPLVWFAPRILDRTIHPVLTAGENPDALGGDMALTGDMNTTTLVCMLVFITLFTWLLFKRVQLAKRELQVEAMRLQLQEDAS